MKALKLILAGICALLLVGFFLLKDEPTPATKTAEAMAIIIAQDKVKERLKLPSSADFALFNGQVADKGKGRYLVRDQVEAKNSFGAVVKSEYLVDLQYNGGDQANPDSWTVKELVIQ